MTLMSDLNGVDPGANNAITSGWFSTKSGYGSNQCVPAGNIVYRTMKPIVSKYTIKVTGLRNYVGSWCWSNQSTMVANTSSISRLIWNVMSGVDEYSETFKSSNGIIVNNGATTSGTVSLNVGDTIYVMCSSNGGRNFSMKGSGKISVGTTTITVR